MNGKKGAAIFVVLMLLVGAAVIVGGPEAQILFTDPHKFWRKILSPLLRVTVLVSVGLFVGQFIEAMGWTAKLARLVGPLMRFGRLSEASGVVFTTGFASGTAAQAMLMNFHQEGRLDKRELILTNLVMALPTYFVHMPTTLFIVVPLTGTAGLLYVGLTLAAAILRTIAVLLISRSMLQPSGAQPAPVAGEERNFREILSDTGVKFVRRLKRMFVYIVPVYLAVALAGQMGFFAWLRATLAGGVSQGFLPVEAMGVVMVGVAAEFTSGFAAAGALLEQGAVTVAQGVVALILGNVIAAPIRAVRHQLPYYLGIFTPRLGGTLIVLNQSLRVFSLLAVAAAYVVVFGL